MIADITIEELYWNGPVMHFFWRDQAITTLEELIKRSQSSADETLGSLVAATVDDDIDDVEENFYEKSVEDLADMYDIELINNNDEDENDEDDE